MNSYHRVLNRVVLGAILALGPPSLTGADSIDFNREIRPLLADACFECHGPDAKTRRAKLRLDTREGLFRTRDGVAVVAPGKSGESELLRRVRSTDPDEQMPPPDARRRLSAEEIERLRRWIDSGADWRGHWAFIPPERPELPTVRDGGWPQNPIDHFVLARLEREGLEPSPRAEREILLRRVTLDLTGLPPTPEEIDAFLDDSSPYAYELAVERLLASPRYGERMVWEWLDAARYADSNGYQSDPERTMWPWRDWAVNALNTNLPFDEFTVEQLAGDQIPDARPDQIMATGFHRNHMHNGEGGRIAEETRVENVIDRTETTATVWLGLTLTCARCHDHKYDPVTQREYYQLYAFFNRCSENGGGRGGQMAPAIAYRSPEYLELRKRADRRIAELTAELVAEESELFTGSGADLPDEAKAGLAREPGKRSDKEIELLVAAAGERAKGGYADRLRAVRKEANERENAEKRLPKVMVLDDAKPRETAILAMGLYNQPGEKVPAGVPAALPPLPDGTTPNRLALARWLVDPQHPLTARVTVNRYWQTFFGVGLVATPEDFGAQGERPSHPELLDWLAREFVDSGWDVKRLHRLIVTSSTYMQSSKRRSDAGRGATDPTNRLLSRGPRYRLPSWMIRDQALFVSGLLTPRFGGAPVKPYQPAGVWAEATFGKKRYSPDAGDKLYRRSLYTFWRRIIGPTMFFDVTPRQTCTVNTSRTNTPLHALITLNDVTYVEASRALAERVLREKHPSTRERIARAFRLVTGRTPELREREILSRRLAVLAERFRENPAAAKELLSAGASPRDESLDLTQHAAFAALATVILNLDETLSKQ